MKEKRLFLGIGIVALTIGAVSFASIMANGKNFLTKADPQTDYQQTLTFTAENMPGESGSVTLNGNTFNYTGVTYNGANLVFGAGSTLEFASQSGETMSANGMYGGSFKSIGFTSVGACNFTYSFNGKTGLVAEAADGETITQKINTRNFSISVTAGSFSTAAFNVKYDCVAPVTSHNVLFVGSSDVVAVDGTWNGDAYVEIMENLGSTVTYTTCSISTHTLRVLADATTQGGTRLRNALNDGVFDTIVLQLPRRITPSATDVKDGELAAIAQIKDLLHSETDDIYVMAPWTAKNPTIFEDDGSVTYKSTGTNESKTAAQMADYYTSIIDEFAEAVDGEAMYLSAAFSAYLGLGNSFVNASRHLLYAYVCYTTFYDRMVPACCTYTNSASSTAVAGIKQVVEECCVH